MVNFYRHNARNNLCWEWSKDEDEMTFVTKQSMLDWVMKNNQYKLFLLLYPNIFSKVTLAFQSY